MKSALRCATAASLLGALLVTSAHAASWKEYQAKDASLSVCHVDLAQETLRTYWRDETRQPYQTLSALATALKRKGLSLLCATNAGIYEQNLRPLGLYIEEGVTLRPLNVRKNAYGNFYMQPNGVLVLHPDGAAIYDTDELAANPALLDGAVSATQSGPLLLIHGRINSQFDPGSGNRLVRNAVCVKSRSEVLLIYSRDPVSFYELASFARDRLTCSDALYLDGSISRMYPDAGRELGPALGPMLGVTAKARTKT